MGDWKKIRDALYNIADDFRNISYIHLAENSFANEMINRAKVTAPSAVNLQDIVNFEEHIKKQIVEVLSRVKNNMNELKEIQREISELRSAEAYGGETTARKASNDINVLNVEEQMLKGEIMTSLLNVAMLLQQQEKSAKSLGIELPLSFSEVVVWPKGRQAWDKLLKVQSALIALAEQQAADGGKLSITELNEMRKLMPFKITLKHKSYEKYLNRLNKVFYPLISNKEFKHRTVLNFLIKFIAHARVKTGNEKYNPTYTHLAHAFEHNQEPTLVKEIYKLGYRREGGLIYNEFSDTLSEDEIKQKVFYPLVNYLEHQGYLYKRKVVICNGCGRIYSKDTETCPICMGSLKKGQKEVLLKFKV